MAAQNSSEARQPDPSSGQDRFLLAIVAGTILLVVASIAIVLVLGRPRPAPPADPNSPAGVVHAYVDAVRSGDVQRARSYLTREARAQIETRDRAYSYDGRASNENVRIVVETVSATETTADVKVTISRFNARPDPFSSSTWHSDVMARLIREDGAWKISAPVDPYMFR
jgi:hypothetical protein